jgi:hypothetical protein
MGALLINGFYANGRFVDEGMLASREWTDLSIGAFKPGRPAPYRIDLDDKTIGWAPATSLQPLGTDKVKVGLKVVVRRPGWDLRELIRSASR